MIFWPEEGYLPTQQAFMDYRCESNLETSDQIPELFRLAGRQGEISDQLLQLGIFLFRFFELPGLGHIHSPVFSSPAVVGLLADLQVFAGLSYGLPQLTR